MSCHFLHDGQVQVCLQRESIVFLVGSCAVVCLWDPVSAIGGAAHYLLPKWDGRGIASTRYGRVAIRALLQRLTEAGAQRHRLRAKLFGGDCHFDALRSRQPGKEYPPNRNLEIALEILDLEHIPLVSAETGGERGQRVVFHADTGESSATNF